LTGVVGSDILRVKGILNVQGKARPVVVQGVQHVFHPPVELPASPGEGRRSRLVFITRNVDKALIEQSYRALTE
jgi:G3E family GTPase